MQQRAPSQPRDRHPKDRDLFARIDAVLAEYAAASGAGVTSVVRTDIPVPPHLARFAAEVDEWHREAVLARARRRQEAVRVGAR
jgi:hypothetical protein